MTENAEIVSKVLVHEENEEILAQIRSFCDVNNLIGMRVRSGDLVEVIKGSINLGAILLNGAEPQATIKMAHQIRRLRPEVPIFLRLEEGSSLEQLGLDAEQTESLFAGQYQLSDLSGLKKLVNSFVFSMHYPPSMVLGIQEISDTALRSTFRDSVVNIGHPFIVRDKSIFGELLSLMELESSWCRGYMMLQVDKPGLIDAIRDGRTSLPPEEARIRGIDSMLSEITNLIWGGIKGRFFSGSEQASTQYRTQVPIIVNHVDKYITFGVNQPQLCIRYTVEDKDDHDSFITVYQRFIFHMAWSPEQYKESENAMNQMLNSGDLELF
ncbi:Conserved hypothetical protein [gamma proteobacterium HdN1]|nr:Conserved hypothetical protein [gamma proteobacterium HdN1]